jgi:hypothetical protein
MDMQHGEEKQGIIAEFCGGKYVFTVVTKGAKELRGGGGEMLKRVLKKRHLVSMLNL